MDMKKRHTDWLNEHLDGGFALNDDGTATLDADGVKALIERLCDLDDANEEIKDLHNEVDMEKEMRLQAESEVRDLQEQVEDNEIAAEDVLTSFFWHMSRGDQQSAFLEVEKIRPACAPANSMI